MSKIAIYGALLGAISLAAQDPGADAKQLAKKIQDEASAKILDSVMIEGRTVKNAPYSATAVTEMTQTLGDGNRINNTSSTTIYRDGQGRERREMANGREISISDPVEGVSYVLNTSEKVARKDGRRVVRIMSDGPGQVTATGGGDRGVATTENRVIVMNSPGSGPETLFFSAKEALSSKNQVKTEDLGTQTIEGVQAQGTRTTITIPEGQIGNEKPIITVSERWYSPELQVVVKSTRDDPRMGKSTYTLTNINRSEPSPTLFQVPPDYTVTDMGVIRRDREERQ